MGWVLRVLQSWKCTLMLTLLKSLNINLSDDCCQLWNPWMANDIQAIDLFSKHIHIKSLTMLKLLRNTVHTKVIHPPVLTWMLYNYIYLDIDHKIGHNLNNNNNNTWLLNSPNCSETYPKKHKKNMTFSLHQGGVVMSSQIKHTHSHQDTPLSLYTWHLSLDFQ